MGDPMAEFASKYETLLLRRERSRLHVTLNRPQVKNALNPVLRMEEQFCDVLLAHKMLLQRPIVVTDDTAIIGRPKERVRALLGG